MILNFRKYKLIELSNLDLDLIFIYIIFFVFILIINKFWEMKYYNLLIEYNNNLNEEVLCLKTHHIIFAHCFYAF